MLLLVVKNLTGDTELLTNINSCEINEEVNGDFSISFTSFSTANNAHSYPLLEEESTVELDGHEYRVKNMTEIRNQKSVAAQHVFFDLIEHQVYGIIGGTRNANDIFSFLLSGTGWTFEIVDVTNYALFANFGENNVLSLIWDACSKLECEIKIMPNKHVKIFKQIGTDTDNQFRYKHNVKTLKKSVDTTNLRTVIKGFGSNGLEVTYRSPMVEVYGERHAEPVRDDRYTIVESMNERIKQELNDVPVISFELEVTRLGFDVGLGDRQWTIYEPMNIDFKTRVIARKWYPFSNKSPVVTLGNKKRNFTDVLTEARIEIDEDKKEYRSKFEQANENINMQVERLDGEVQEAISQIDVKAEGVLIESKAYTDTGIDEAYNYFDGQIESVEASINVVAGTVALKASVSYVDGQVGAVNSNIGGLDSRIRSAEGSLSVQAGLISSKVSQSDFTGNTIASLINQSATTVDIIASKINFVGAVSVLSDITGSLGNITAGNITGATIRGGQFVLDGGTLDLRLGNIIWGNNVPGNVLYAQNAGNANTLNGSYTYQSFSLTGHVHADSQYVKPYTGQSLKLWRSGNRVRVYDGSSYTELTGTVG